MRCHICKAENPERFLSLGHQPPSDAFLKYEELEMPARNRKPGSGNRETGVRYRLLHHALDRTVDVCYGKKNFGSEPERLEFLADRIGIRRPSHEIC